MISGPAGLEVFIGCVMGMGKSRVGKRVLSGANARYQMGAV